MGNSSLKNPLNHGVPITAIMSLSVPQQKLPLTRPPRKRCCLVGCESGAWQPLFFCFCLSKADSAPSVPPNFVGNSTIDSGRASETSNGLAQPGINFTLPLRPGAFRQATEWGHARVGAKFDGDFSLFFDQGGGLRWASLQTPERYRCVPCLRSTDLRVG